MADYRLDQSVIERRPVAEEAVNTAQAMVEVFRECLHDPRRSAISAKLRAWERHK